MNENSTKAAEAEKEFIEFRGRKYTTKCIGMLDENNFSTIVYQNCCFSSLYSWHENLEKQFTLYFENCLFYKEFSFDAKISQKFCEFKFINCVFIDVNLSSIANRNFFFNNSQLENVSFAFPKIQGTWNFYTSKFKNINFIGCKEENILLTPHQRENSYFSEKEKELLEANQKQEKIIQKEKKQDEMDAENGILKLKEDFEKEEIFWFVILGLFFLGLFVPAILILCYKEINSLLFIPISLLSFTGFYFSIYQYSRAKNLRIENQNKYALIQQFKSFELSVNDEERKQKIDIVMPNYAKVVFSKAIPPKNEKNLPLDEIIRLAEIFKSK